MNNIIKCYKDALDIRSELACYQMSGWHFLYRGHSKLNYKLLSMAGRKGPLDGDLLKSERACLKEFRHLAEKENLLDFKVGEYNTDLFYMSVGRHLGLDCRLLDWTASLGTALFFASSANEKVDGQLWILLYRGTIDDSFAQMDPFTIDKTVILKENYILPDAASIESQPLGILRRFSQNGFFTLTPTELVTTPLDEISTRDFHLTPIVIDSNAKRDIINNVTKDNELLHLSIHEPLESAITTLNAKFFEQH